MSIINYAILSFLGLAFVALAILFVLLILRNVSRGRLARNELMQKVESLRMSRMLKALNIDYHRHLFNAPLNRIYRSMRNCETCTSYSECDRQLQKGELSLEEIDFCPNQDCLREYGRIENTVPNAAQNG